jgi:hypothetical protein
VGLFAPDTFTFYLRNENNAGFPDAGQFAYGFSTWRPLAGAWSGPRPSGGMSGAVAIRTIPGPPTMCSRPGCEPRSSDWPTTFP